MLTVACCVAGGAIGLAIFHGRHLGSGLRLLPGEDIDSRFVASILEHLREAALGRTLVSSPRFFYPTPGILGYSDTHALLAVPHTPLRALGLSIVSAAALSTILLNAATWIATFAFLRVGLGFHQASALVGAYVFSFSSHKLNQLMHPQVQALPLIPLMAWGLVSAAEAAARDRPRRAWRALILFSLLLHAQLWTCFQVTYIWVLYVAVVAGLIVAREPPRRAVTRWASRNALGLALLVSVNAIALIPFLSVYLPPMGQHGGRSWDEVVSLLPRWSSYLLMGDNLVWGGASRRLVEWLPPNNHSEHALALGVVGSLALLASFGWASSRYARSDLSALERPHSAPGRLDLAMLASLGGLALLLLTFSVRGYSVWWLVWTALPGATAVRTVSRYSLVTSIGLALFCAVAVDTLLDRLREKSPAARRLGLAGAALLALLFVVEQAGSPPTYDRTEPDARVAGLVTRLAERPRCRAFAVAYTGPKVQQVPQVDAMLASLETGLPTLNGYSSVVPKGWALWAIHSPDYPAHVREWIQRHSLENTCVVRIEAPSGASSGSSRAP